MMLFFTQLIITTECFSGIEAKRYLYSGTRHENLSALGSKQAYIRAFAGRRNYRELFFPSFVPTTAASLLEQIVAVLSLVSQFFENVGYLCFMCKRFRVTIMGKKAQVSVTRLIRA